VNDGPHGMWKSVVLPLVVQIGITVQLLALAARRAKSTYTYSVVRVMTSIAKSIAISSIKNTPV